MKTLVGRFKGTASEFSEFVVEIEGRKLSVTCECHDEGRI